MSLRANSQRIIIDDREMARESLVEAAARAASGLAAVGLKQGDVMASLMRNDFACLEAARAATMLGVRNVPLNWHNKPAETAYVLNDSGAVAIVGHADLLLAAREVISPGMHVFVVPVEGRSVGQCEATRDALELFESAQLWIDVTTDHAVWREPPPPDPGSIFYTSGTTGRPKGVVKVPMDEDGVKAFTSMHDYIYEVASGERVMVLGPLYHAAPFFNATMAVQGSAEMVVMLHRFDPEKVLQLIESLKITTVTLVPTMFVRMLKLPDSILRGYDMSSLTSVTHVAAPCPVDVKSRMIEWWGPIIKEVYGGTEMGCSSFVILRNGWLIPEVLGGRCQARHTKSLTSRASLCLLARSAKYSRIIRTTPTSPI